MFNLLYLLTAIFLISIISLASFAQPGFDATVSKSGDGQYKTVYEAIMAAPQDVPSASRPWRIHVRPGIYRELIYVQQERHDIHLIGDDSLTTIITMDLQANLPGPDGKAIGTFRTPTAQIDGNGFSAENITFENSAGPVGQAVALRVDASQASFRNCRFLGWQDTLFLNRGTQFFLNCYIAGHIDFIFGGAAAWFENCTIHCLRDGYITAASTPQSEPFGFVFSHCRITGEKDARVYLGRPWRGFGSTTFLYTDMSDVIRPEGWHNWTGPEREKTARYAEYGNAGVGAAKTQRVAWVRQLSQKEAQKITLIKVLKGWDPGAVRN